MLMIDTDEIRGQADSRKITTDAKMASLPVHIEWYHLTLHLVLNFADELRRELEFARAQVNGKHLEYKSGNEKADQGSGA